MCVLTAWAILSAVDGTEALAEDGGVPAVQITHHAAHVPVYV